MLSLNNVALRRGVNLLFEKASFTVHSGYKVGLIGANGSGKSSLFEVILSRLDTDTGSVELAANTTIAHMAQEVAGSNEAAIDYVLAGDTRYVEITKQLEAAEREERFDSIAGLRAPLDRYRWIYCRGTGGTVAGWAGV